VEVLVTYDIATADRAGERRLLNVAKICESFGLRVQYSVFECRLSHSRLEQLITDLDMTIDSRTDRVDIYVFPGILADSKRSLGRQATHSISKPWIV